MMNSIKCNQQQAALITVVDRVRRSDGLETITAVDQQRAVSNSNNVRIILNTRAYFSVYYYRLVVQH